MLNWFPDEDSDQTGGPTGETSTHRESQLVTEDGVEMYDVKNKRKRKVQGRTNRSRGQINLIDEDLASGT